MYLQLMYFYSEYKFAEWYRLYCSFLSGNRSSTVLHIQTGTTSRLLAPKQPCCQRIKFLLASFLCWIPEVGFLIEQIFHFIIFWTFVLELPASSGSQTPDSTLCFPAMKFRITSGSAIVAALRHLRTSFSLQPALWKRHRWIFHKIY